MGAHGQDVHEVGPEAITKTNGITMILGDCGIPCKRGAKDDKGEPGMKGDKGGVVPAGAKGEKGEDAMDICLWFPSKNSCLVPSKRKL